MSHEPEAYQLAAGLGGVGLPAASSVSPTSAVTDGPDVTTAPRGCCRDGGGGGRKGGGGQRPARAKLLGAATLCPGFRLSAPSELRQTRPIAVGMNLRGRTFETIRSSPLSQEYAHCFFEESYLPAQMPSATKFRAF